MANSDAFEKLSLTDRVRVNAVILDNFQHNHNGFIDTFRSNLDRLAVSRDTGFQILLDGMRDTLAENIGKLPKLRVTGDTFDIGRQREMLVMIKSDMVNERGTPSAPHWPAMHYQHIAGGETFGSDVRKTLPKLAADTIQNLNGIMANIMANNCQYVGRSHSHTTCPVPDSRPLSPSRDRF